jgi:hypothetical protein
MTKLCARGKSAAKRKFKVYPSAYANAYASKICAGKIKDPSGTRRKDWGPKKAFLGGLFKKKDEKKKEIQKEENIFKKRKQDQRTKQQRLEELKKEMGMSKGGGADMGKVETEKKTKKMYGDRNRRRRQLIDIQNPKSEYDEKGKLIYTEASQGKIMQVANKLEKASKAHAGQARTLKSLKLSRGGGIAIKGTNFKGVF